MQPTKVRKRSGQKVSYDRAKIFNAIAGANRDATTPADKLSDDDLELVTDSVEREIGDSEVIGVEAIQDQVEKCLMAHGFYDVAKQFIVYRQKHSQRRAAQIPPLKFNATRAINTKITFLMTSTSSKKFFHQVQTL